MCKEPSTVHKNYRAVNKLLKYSSKSNLTNSHSEPKQAVLLGLKGKCQKLEFLQWPHEAGSKTKRIMLKMVIFTTEINIHPVIQAPIHFC